MWKFKSAVQRNRLKKDGLLALTVIITAVLSVALTTFVDQKRWEAHERQQQEDLQRRMLQGENEIRAMNIKRP
jgi:hypothetical protein